MKAELLRRGIENPSPKDYDDALSFIESLRHMASAPGEEQFVNGVNAIMEGLEKTIRTGVAATGIFIALVSLRLGTNDATEELARGKTDAAMRWFFGSGGKMESATATLRNLKEEAEKISLEKAGEVVVVEKQNNP